jgi:deazaflavin-dependent oxidoreductase (nitroreductase family)
VARIPLVDPTARALRRRIITPVALSKPGYWYVRNVAPKIDNLHLLGGRVTSIPMVPLLHLSSTGAKSGKPRRNTLVYFSDGDRAVCMASNYGGPGNPAWYHNVKANPDVTLSSAGRTGRYRAHEATGEEHERLWATAKSYTRAYERYEHTANGRHIPVIVFTPLDD